MTNRRDFIKTTTLASSALFFPNILIPQKKESLGIALVGLGYYSTDILAKSFAFTKSCHLAGIVTGTPSKIPTWKKNFNLKDSNIYNYENMHEMANNPDIDVVYIVLPNKLHLEYCKIAANAGKHVFCEKPLAMNGKEAAEIIAVCKQNKVMLTVGYRLQHEPNHRTLIEWARSKPFGNIKEINAAAGWMSNGGNNWKLRAALGGGAVMDMGTYSLNAARYITQEEPIAVTAHTIIARPDIFFEVDETTKFMLEFPSGAIANCTTSLGQNVNNLEINCEKGSYSLSPFQGYNGVKGFASDGTLLNKTIDNQQAKQMDDDSKAIMNGWAPMVQGEDGLRDMRIIDAISSSAKYDGQRIVL